MLLEELESFDLNFQISNRKCFELEE